MRVFLIRKARVTPFYLTIPARHTPKPHAKKHFLYAFFIPEKPVNPALIRLNH